MVPTQEDRDRTHQNLVKACRAYRQVLELDRDENPQMCGDEDQEFLTHTIQKLDTFMRQMGADIQRPDL